MWHVCGHFSVCTVSQWGLGILHGNRGVCGPHQKHRLNPPQLPARDRARAPQGWEGAGCILKGGFCTNILLLADREAQHAPALDISLALHLQAEHRSPIVATAPHHAQGEVDLPAALCGRTSLPTAFHDSLLRGVRYWNL